jgi:flagellar biosynthesis protein
MTMKKESVKKAAALRYRPDKDRAPRLVAKGNRRLAERIIEVAKEHQIPLQEDPGLVEVLSSLDLYEEIPPSLYKAVAEVLVFIYRMHRRLQDLPGHP